MNSSRRSRSSFKARIDHDPINLFLFLHENDYEHPWSIESLSDRNCLRISVEIDGKVEAFLWASWVDHETLCFHGCTRRRLWLTPPIMERMFVISELFGANKLITQPAGKNATRIRTMFLKRGFKEDGDYLVYELRPNGIYGQQAEETETSRGPAAAASTPA